VRIYSGASGALRSSARNQVPVTIVEATMDADASVDQDIPASDNGFVYVIRGPVRIGREGTLLEPGQVGWLDRSEDEGASVLRAVAGGEGARFVVYTGQPQGDPI